MARITLRAAAFTTIVSACSLNCCLAQSSSSDSPPPAPASAPAELPSSAAHEGRRLSAQPSASAPDAAPNPPGYAYDRTVQQVGANVQHNVVVHAAGPVDAPLYLPPTAPNITPTGYPYLNAPMYPCPLPYIPYQVGATLITNQAFDPHEMLYPHTYRSIYPPYYYEVSGGWKVFPWGVAQSEHWKLRGTYVSVKYKSGWGLFSGWCPPAVWKYAGNPPIFQTWTGHRWSAD
ncbi:MAG TPA: hypothetical protein VEI07_02565 [Planctomycetaceae bacterium]|nr:hypothetical protein [Planctomycetaceae bacterium]